MLRLEASLKGKGAPDNAYLYLFVASQQGYNLECNNGKGVLVNVDRLINGWDNRPQGRPFFQPATAENLAAATQHPGIKTPEKWWPADEFPLLGANVYVRTPANAASQPNAKLGLLSASEARSDSPWDPEPGEHGVPSHRRKSEYARPGAGKADIQFETRVGGFLLPATALCDAYYRMANPSAGDIKSMEWTVDLVDDAIEYLIRTTLVSAATRPIDDNLHVQHGWSVVLTVRKVTPRDPHAGPGSLAWSAVQQSYRDTEASAIRGTNAENARLAATFIAEYVRGFAPFRSADAQQPYPGGGIMLPRFKLSSDGRRRSRTHRRGHSNDMDVGRSGGGARFRYADVVEYYTSAKRCKSPRGLNALTPRTSNMLAMHMPTATTPIGLIPVGEFHYQTLLPSATATDLTSFGAAFERVLRTQCIAVGLASADEVAANPRENNLIRNFTRAVTWAASVDLQRTRAVTPELCTTFYMACDALARALVEFSVHIKYRGDYSVLRNGVTIPVERQDIDGITGASGSGDCEDVAAMTQCIAHAVLLGPTTPGPTAGGALDDPAWRTIQMAFGAHGRFRPVAWQSPMIRAAQLLLTHYVPVVVLGSVTDSFPGTSKVVAAGLQALDLKEEQERLRAIAQQLAEYYPKAPSDPSTNVALSAAAADMMGSDALLPALVYDTEVNNASTVVAHQYGMLLPLEDALTMWCSAGGAHVPQLQKLNTAYTTELDATPLVYPALVLESTSKNSPYVVGASVYMTEVAARLTRLGRGDEARALTRHVTKKIAPAERRARRWFSKLHKSGLLDPTVGGADGVALNFRDTHSLRIVAGDLETRRGTAFYREVLHVSSPWIMTLAYPDMAEAMTTANRGIQPFRDPNAVGAACDYFDYMTLCVADKESEFWGVPLERILRPARADTTTLVSAIAGRSVSTGSRAAFHVSAFEGALRVQPPSAMGRLAAPNDVSVRGGDDTEDYYSPDALGRGTRFEGIRTVSLVREYDGTQPPRHANTLQNSAAWKKLMRFMRRNKGYSIVHVTHSPAGHVLNYSPETITLYISIVQ